MKVGIIRCMQTEDYCPGSADFKVMREHTGAFGDAEGDIELVGFTNCGGCPGKRRYSGLECLWKEARTRLSLPHAFKREILLDIRAHLQRK